MLFTYIHYLWLKVFKIILQVLKVYMALWHEEHDILCILKRGTNNSLPVLIVLYIQQVCNAFLKTWKGSLYPLFIHINFTKGWPNWWLSTIPYHWKVNHSIMDNFHGMWEAHQRHVLKWKYCQRENDQMCVWIFEGVTMYSSNLVQ